MRRIVIVGGGTAGWMAAAALGRFLGHTHAITLVESDAIGTVGVGEATIPQIRTFNAGLGIDENRFVAATQATFKLGIEFAGWHSAHDRYIHAFGDIGRSLGLIGYHHYWLRGQGGDGSASLWDASPCAIAAKQNRFAPVVAKPGQPPTGVAWAYQFDAGLYAGFLRNFAEDVGIIRKEGIVQSVELDGEHGSITSVTLQSGECIEGDFFIDCSGFRALLIGEALGSEYDDWSQWLRCDRAVTVASDRMPDFAPYTRATAKPAGWQWRIPLQHRTGNGHVYCSAHMSDDEAAAILLSGIDGEPAGNPRPLTFRTGKRRKSWRKNCVALGLSSGFMEPLESTSIHLIQSAIARLLQLLPAGRPHEAEIAEYNRQTDSEWERIRDFLVLHYHANDREEPFWRAVRNVNIPKSLSHKIDLFRANGRIFREDGELFTEAAWVQVMIGQGIVPNGYHPLADQLSESDLVKFTGMAARHAESVAASMPPHAEYITRHCASPETASNIRNVA